jgi:hypothetical protein
MSFDCNTTRKDSKDSKDSIIGKDNSPELFTSKKPFSTKQL